METLLQQLADQLVKAKVRWAFGVSGSGPSLQLISRLEEKGVTYIPASHEASAALMAGAVARATGDISVAISIKGPGFANLLAGISANYFENAPVITISESFGDKTPVHRQHKRLDQKALVQPLVKARLSVNHVPKQFPKLIGAARTEAPGPVHIDLGEESARTGVWFRKDARTGAFSSPALFQKMLAASQQPLLIVGSLARRRGWGAVLSKLRIPVLTTVAAKGILDERSPYAAGIYTGTGKDLAPEGNLIAQADLIIGIGLRNTEVVQAQAFGRPTIMFDEIKTDLSQGFEARGVVDISKNKTASTLWSSVAKKEWGIAPIRVAMEKMWSHLLSSSWLPAHAFARLNDISQPHGLVLDTGSFCTIGEHIWQARKGREFLGSSNGRFMGTAVPTAIGFSLARPQLPIFCVSGDGGFRMYPSEIKIAVEKNLPICFVLMMDGFYGSIACVPQKKPVSQAATKLIRPSWQGSVAGMDVPAVTVGSEKEFADALSGWNQQGPMFIEASFDPIPYQRMTDHLR